MIPQPCEVCGYDDVDNNNHIKHCHRAIRMLTERLKEVKTMDIDRKTEVLKNGIASSITDNKQIVCNVVVNFDAEYPYDISRGVLIRLEPINGYSWALELLADGTWDVDVLNGA